MTTHPRLWTLAALVLLAGVLPSRLAADSPTWAEEPMRLHWPEALGRATPAEQITSRGQSDMLAEVPYGHSTTAVPASSREDLVETAAPIEQTGLMHPLPPPAGPCAAGVCEGWQVLPAGILYKSYTAGVKEPRMGAAWLVEKDRGAVLEDAIGGRMGLLRYGTPGPINPQGFQWDLEAAALLRQDPEAEWDVEAADFRIGTVLTWRRGPTAAKFGYYHLSSHVGDEFLLRNPTFQRLNYVRDAILFGVRQYLTPDLQAYGEIAYAFKATGGAEPLELQFGLEYVPWEPTCGNGAPFAAINFHSRQEFDFGGNVNVLAGWEWRGRTSDRRLRIGGQYYNGKEIQWSFFDESVSFTGVGIWYDF